MNWCHCLEQKLLIHIEDLPQWVRLMHGPELLLVNSDLKLFLSFPGMGQNSTELQLAYMVPCLELPISMGSLQIHGVFSSTDSFFPLLTFKGWLVNSYCRSPIEYAAHTSSPAFFWHADIQGNRVPTQHPRNLSASLQSIYCPCTVKITSSVPSLPTWGIGTF